MFADLAGYTRYCSERDPEEVHLVVRPLMNGLRNVCEELGGLVPVIEGDGFMAAFGARETTSDDPVRAVLAAARMQCLVRDRGAVVPGGLPGLRVGMNVGEVVVAPSWEAGGLSVSGDVVNVTSRLCNAAGEGEVLATGAVLACVPLDNWGPLRPLTLRDRSGEVQVSALAWEAVEAPQIAPRAESRTGFVPRAELRSVCEAVDAGEALVVLGEAGIGKSRLVSKAIEIAGRRLLRVRFTPFAPPPDAWRDTAADVSTAVVSAVQRRRVRRLAGEQPDTDELDTYREQLEALAEALVATGATEPIALVLDDVDEAGEDELAMLTTLLGRPGRSLPVLMTARRPPGLDAPVITLEALSREASVDFVEHVLPGAPEVLVHNVVGRAGGVPLFIEQYARLLVEDGTVALDDAGCRLIAPDRLDELPTAMRLYVAARLDTLDSRTRRVLSSAAVAGPLVDPELLRFLSGRFEELADDVEILVARGFLEWVPGSDPTATRLRFRHEVLRDVAYEGLLKSDRVATHRAAAEWYAVLPVVQLLAEEAGHLEAAIALGDDDCALVRRTVEVLGRYAASVVVESPALADAAADRALRLDDQHPQCSSDLMQVRLTKSRALLHHGEQERASSLAREVADEAARRGMAEMEALARLTAGTADALSRPAQSQQELDRAEVLFREADDSTGLARVEAARAEAGGIPLVVRIEAWERAHREAMKVGENRLASLAAQDLAVHTAMRNPVEAERWRATAAQLRRADDVVGEARLAFADALAHLMRAEYEASAAAAGDAAHAAWDTGDRHLFMNAALCELEALVLQGGLSDAEVRRASLLEIAVGRPTPHLQVDCEVFGALLLQRQGRGDEASALLEETKARSEALGEHYVSQWHSLAARVALERGSFAEAVAHADRAADMEQGLGRFAWAARERTTSLIARFAAGQHIALGDLAEARASARAFGASTVAAVLARWNELADTLVGIASHQIDVPDGPTTTDTKALDLELLALRMRRPELLREAAAQWGAYGTTVWRARALLWHSELTGAPSTEAEALLDSLAAPDGLAETLRAQVRGLY